MMLIVVVVVVNCFESIDCFFFFLSFIRCIEIWQNFLLFCWRQVIILFLTIVVVNIIGGWGSNEDCGDDDVYLSIYLSIYLLAYHFHSNIIARFVSV